MINYEARHVDVEDMYNEFNDLDMEDVNEGYETWKCVYEERNVFCSSYNVFVLQTKLVLI